MARTILSGCLLLLLVGVAVLAPPAASQEKAQAQRKPLAGNAKATLGLNPLSEMSASDRYKGQDGGLYGGGQNEPPKDHLMAALKAAARIQPLDGKGNPAPQGKIALISLGMSNTTQEFSRFMQIAGNDRSVQSRLVLVDGAQGGQEASGWAESGRRGRDPWEELDRRLKQADVSAAQVQVAWIKQARAVPSALGEFPRHAEVLRDNLVTTVQKLRQRFPNLQLVYLSSRIYGGNAVSNLNPEPYAYEGAFAVRWVIQEQMRGGAALNHDPARGPVKAPVVLWGPYLWADGTTPRKADGLKWEPADFGKDGTHPGLSAKDKVARQLLAFFKEDVTARSWFAGKK
jgi:hypothetical protein